LRQSAHETGRRFPVFAAAARLSPLRFAGSFFGGS
jgi:hypothetical protein